MFASKEVRKQRLIENYQKGIESSDKDTYLGSILLIAAVMAIFITAYCILVSNFIGIFWVTLVSVLIIIDMWRSVIKTVEYAKDFSKIKLSNTFVNVLTYFFLYAYLGMVIAKVAMSY